MRAFTGLLYESSTRECCQQLEQEIASLDVGNVEWVYDIKKIYNNIATLKEISTIFYVSSAVDLLTNSAKFHQGSPTKTNNEKRNVIKDINYILEMGIVI